MKVAKYGYVVDTLLPLVGNESYIFAKTGVQTYEELRLQIELLAPFEVFNLAVNLLNAFPKINPLLDKITISGADTIISEIFMEGNFDKSTDMAKGKGVKPVKRSIAIPVDNFDYEISVDCKMSA
jgi:hypothetical protein